MVEIPQRNCRSETESQPLILPFAFRQLQEASSVTVNKEFSCCWWVYSVTCPDAGTLFTLEGFHGYSLKDNNGRKLAQIQRSLPICTPYTLRVMIRDSAPITIAAQTQSSQELAQIQRSLPICTPYTLLVMIRDSAPITIGAQMGSQVVLIQDGSHTVLRIRKPTVVMYETEFEIMSNTTNTKIGVVTKEGPEYKVHFPNEVDVRYKAALIAACIYLDALPTKRPARPRINNGARPVSNTYVNFQDTLFSSLRISETFASYST